MNQKKSRCQPSKKYAHIESKIKPQVQHHKYLFHRKNNSNSKILDSYEIHLMETPDNKFEEIEFKPKTLKFTDDSDGRSSISSCFSLFEPNEELKSFYRKEVMF